MEDINILIAGDFCPIGRNKATISQKEFSKLFNGFEKFSKAADFSIVNLECPVTNSTNNILKTGPCIKTEDLNTFEALKYADFNLLTLANNHILDYGEQGVLDTIENARTHGFEVLGAGFDRIEAAKPHIVEIKSKTIGIINIAENEFCAATNTTAGAYTLDLIDNIKQIKSAKSKVDYLILVYHGGREHYQLPTPNQRDRFRFFIDNGVDAIVGHHTHCYSGFEYYNGKPIIYSLGNFVFDYKEKYQKGKWTEGYAINLKLGDDAIEIELIPYFQARKENPNIVLFNEIEKSAFNEKIKELNSIIINDELFFASWNQYIENQSPSYLANFFYKNKYIRALTARGLFPTVNLKRHNALLLNLMRCETHHEISKDVLVKYINK